jgi:pimeloyl-ACP methyl ester carboxylesterase
MLLLAIFTVFTLSPPPETRLAEVAPVHSADQLVRTPEHDRAVLLIHGLEAHLFSSVNVTKAQLHSWQYPKAAMVRALAGEFDVFAFAYGQNEAADDLADLPDLGGAVRAINALGYRELVLVGHSAGGLIARQFVEDHPDAGVTKVIQLDTPNGGSFWASVIPVRPNQREFMESLSKGGRSLKNRQRAGRTIPEGVEMVCVVGTLGIGGDGLVSIGSQWPTDLRDQGIPAYAVLVSHLEVVHLTKSVALIARLVREPQPRWNAEAVTVARRKFGLP